ncbi:hypothetical protein M419DRAFT_118631 [Trichoderma reesei RUT C-30]|uniref:Uncharacterized protein n=1 Tax=Hypocrea jecorina (strain ATCC 56765 / BCRC 32924 / NRRL 11460 / Rut C-30) TaxID=1344414 RepID=A0A024SAC1_HYPJR|nr:hypothetical protein M419DRAFT_118631 [Trichoderma reesei RUT C-30]
MERRTCTPIQVCLKTPAFTAIFAKNPSQAHSRSKWNSKRLDFKATIESEPE